MSESKLLELSTDFAVKTIKGHCSLVNQLERSSTSIGANIYEAQYAQGKKDFISKLDFDAGGEFFETRGCSLS